MEIPIWEKANLTIKEAALYFNIGENTLRSIISQTTDTDLVIYVGKKILIKRQQFEKWLNKQYIIR